VHENNMNCIALAESKKLQLWTKYIALKYHFFRRVIESGEVKLHYIDSKE